MCSVKVEACEAKAAIGLVESGCGGIDVGAPGAKTEQSDSEPATPKNAPLPLPKPIKDEDDDPLTYLAELFSFTTLEDSDDDSEDGSEDECVPLSPRSKGYDLSNCNEGFDVSKCSRSLDLNTYSRSFGVDTYGRSSGSSKYCFYTPSGLYYYDNFRRVYSEDGTLISQSPYESQLDDLLSPSFLINGVSYWWDDSGLLSQDPSDGSFCRVHAWPSSPEPNLLDLNNFLDASFTAQTDVTVIEPNSNPGSLYGTEFISTPTPTPEQYPTPKSKLEVLSPNFGSGSLQVLQDGSKPLVWSPTSSTYKSPLLPAAASRESSMAPGYGPSLFAAPQPNIPVVSKWQHEVAKARKDAEVARPTRKPIKEERRRCPECKKVFRRPSSLDDHLNVHSGQKPHICLFEGCNTGFATKSNMKRHFTTHRVGPLERYRPGKTPQDSEPLEPKPNKSGKVPRATATYNSKAFHNGRFRISA